ncbi:FAD-binding oxidoreductase [Tabrizicola caldifontis]|uniref:FAD-binding oxidoreductase n=1 Tax=Tabrizicola caldifontis TaxID=2528036 RepID=UPI001081E33E|nr:FAD-binding oxidoreductase [Rhodobacter sp. YIM 73028]
MSSISGKTTTDWAAFAAALAPVEVIDEPVLVRKRSRDFFWYSPILDRRLKACFGDLVARPKSPAEMARCLSLAARHRVPVTLRGGGTGNYGQSVPMEGGLIIDTTAMGEILEIGPDFVRVQAGCNIAKLNQALKEKGRELPIFPSTQDIATIGGFISGGSAGIGTVSHGMLRDAGNILEIRALSAEDPPREVVFSGEGINMIHHAWGINGVITELALRTVPTEDWIGCIVTFDDYLVCHAAAIDLALSETIRRKLCSTLDARIGTYFDRLKGIVPEGHAMLVTLIPRDQMGDFRALVARHGGHVALAMDEAERTARKLPHVFEFSYNHTTLQALKSDRSVTYLQVLFPAPVNVAKVAELRAVLGDDVYMHHEFARMGGDVVSFDLPLVKYTTDERLYQIMALYQAHGCPVSDPHSCIIEDGGMKKADYRHLAWKKRMDPLGLLNSPKSREWARVRDLSPEAIEALHQT